MNIQEIIDLSFEYNKSTNVPLIKSAFEFAKKIHEGQKRFSGDPYLIHPFEVAIILTTLKADSITIAAGLLHDTLEDSNRTLNSLKIAFGDDVANIVDGVTKISKLKLPDTYEDESFKKLVLAAVKDIRVLFVKLADRLHNMRTLDSHPIEEKKELFGRECLEMYGPLAYRLGLKELKNELEDLGLKYFKPKEYYKIVNGLEERRYDRENRMKNSMELIKLELNKEINCEIYGRAKHIYSIYRKLQTHTYGLEKMYDLIALRIITNSIDDCYKSLRVAQSLWRTIPNTFKDYIVTPKPNGYQSLHLAVMVEDGRPMELQIRTNKMHELNEFGISSHWKYKGETLGADFDKRIKWLNEVLEIQKESADEFVRDIKVDFFSESIFVFTPKKEIKELPAGSTVVDFAYSIHSTVGDKCAGAYVNGKYVGIKTRLKNGDIIEIINSKNQVPSKDWLTFVRTSKARNHVRRFIRLSGNIPSGRKNEIENLKKEVNQTFVKIQGVNDPEVKFALCCKPLPGEEIIGFMTSYKRVKIHKVGCNDLDLQKQKKRVVAGWNEQINSSVELKILCFDRVGIFSEIINLISSLKINIKKASVKNINETQGLCSILLLVDSLGLLMELIKKLEHISGVSKIYVGDVN